MGHRDPVLLFDNSCGLCRRGVRFILAHERRHTLRFAPLDGSFAARVFQRFPGLARVDSMIWVDVDERGDPAATRTDSSAGLRIARYMGGPWAWLTVLRLVPRSLRDWAYGRIARYRHRLAGTQGGEDIPPEARERTLE